MYDYIVKYNNVNIGSFDKIGCEASDFTILHRRMIEFFHFLKS